MEEVPWIVKALASMEIDPTEQAKLEGRASKISAFESEIIEESERLALETRARTLSDEQTKRLLNELLVGIEEMIRLFV